MTSKLQTHLLHGFILATLISIVGCASMKEATGQYVADAVTQKVVGDVEDLLEKRGLSISEIKSVTDINDDGKVDRQEVLESTKAATRDFVLLEARSYVEGKIQAAEERIRENQENNTSSRLGQVKGQIENKANELWKWILGLIAAYLSKQIYSAKQDGKRDARIDVLEKMTGRDIDGDGKIGGVPVPSDQNKAEIA
jgi:nucleoside diphosphate kinase